MKVRINTTILDVSFAAMVMGFTLSPMNENTEMQKALGRFFGQVLLDVAGHTIDKNQQFALLSILYINVQVMELYDLEKKTLDALSRYPDQKLAHSLICKEYYELAHHLDDLSGIMGSLLIIVGIHDPAKALMELEVLLYEFEKSV